jgi:predicted enzyme related to lactoylglutathione lyase
VGYLNVLPSLQVSDFDPTAGWYARLIGRKPDRRPMDGCVEWQLTSGGGLQVYRNPDAPTVATLIIGVDDLETEAQELDRRGIKLEPYTAPSGRFRIAEITDPAGNTVVIVQDRSPDSE